MLILGDMDPYTIDGCSNWCDQKSLLRLREEVTQLREKLQSQADLYFGETTARVLCWSDFYKIDDFEQALKEASNPEKWGNRERKLMQQSTTMYLDQWGYRSLQNDLGVSTDQMKDFIRQDVVRTAAQYSLEGDILKTIGCIQGWAEKVPVPSWPRELSSYDGQKRAVSINLLGSTTLSSPERNLQAVTA